MSHVTKKWGKKVYIVAADYNYGQIVTAWVKKYVEQAGGESVGIEFFPLDVTNFGATISKIQEAKPDFVWSALVGGAHMSFYRQWKAAGMTGKLPIASTTFAGGNEHIVLSPEECNGILICQNVCGRNWPRRRTRRSSSASISASARTIRTSPNWPWALTRA